MFRFLLPILAFSAVAHGGVLPVELSNDQLPKENIDDVYPEVIDSNVYPDVMDSNVYPDLIDSNVYPETLDDNLLSEEDSDPSRIVGGTNTAITAAPWQAFMRINNNFGCGAVLISSTWALSAAHCTINRASTATTVLVAGTFNRQSGGQVRRVSQIINHRYNPRTHDHDICLMRAATPFSLSTSVRAASLPAQGANFNAGTFGLASGWGATREGGTSLPTTLQSVWLPVVAPATCRANYGAFPITNSMLCAGFAAGGRSICQGDSGGPFAIGNVVAGISSFLNGCGRPNSPSVFTRVAAYRNWIRTNSGV